MKVVNGIWSPKEPQGAHVNYVTDLLSGENEGHISPSNSMGWSSEEEEEEQVPTQQGNLSLEGLAQEFHEFRVESEKQWNEANRRWEYESNHLQTQEEFLKGIWNTVNNYAPLPRRFPPPYEPQDPTSD
jgi:hypothetical protein